MASKRLRKACTQLSIRRLLSCWTILLLLALFIVSIIGLYSNHLLANNTHDLVNVSKIISHIISNTDQLVINSFETALAKQEADIVADKKNLQLQKIFHIKIQQLKNSRMITDSKMLVEAMDIATYHYNQLITNDSKLIKEKKHVFTLTNHTENILSSMRDVIKKNINSLITIQQKISLSNDTNSALKPMPAMHTPYELLETLKKNMYALLLLGEQIQNTKNIDALDDIDNKQIKPLMYEISATINKLQNHSTKVNKPDNNVLKKELGKFSLNFSTLAHLYKDDDSILRLRKKVILSSNKIDTMLKDIDNASVQLLNTLNDLNSKEIQHNKNLAKKIITINYSIVLGVGALIILILYFVSMYIKKRIQNKLDKAQFYMHKIAQGDLETNIAISAHNDEIDQMLKALEKMKQQLRANISQIQNQHKKQMHYLSNMVSGVAHEIRNPMNFIINFSELLSDNLTLLQSQIMHSIKTKKPLHSQESQDIMQDLTISLKKVIAYVNRVDSIITRMVMHTQPASQKVKASINAIAKSAITESRGKDVAKTIKLTEDFDSTMQPLLINPRELKNVLVNIIDNACYFSSHSKKAMQADFIPTVKVTTKNLDKTIEIHIWDNGDGIDMQYQDKIFNPFFTTKPTGSGIGLGLSLAYDIITSLHNGDLHFKTSMGEYTEFIISLSKAS